MWGRVESDPHSKTRGRDTPTCVGKSHLFLFINILHGGHPHVCGEENIRWIYRIIIEGTPPRVWGRVFVKQSGGGVRRDTPTCVGKSSLISRGARAVRGHPHVCGEESPDRCPANPARGTPPRVWGRVYSLLLSSTTRGDTPTCVGKSSLSASFLFF